MTQPAPTLTDIYQTAHPRLLARVRRMVGSHATAEDLVHQAFANVLGRDLDVDAGYMMRAVRNLALNYMRDSRRRAEIADPGVFETIADPRPGPEAIALHRAELRRLLRAIAQLPCRRREAFVLNRIAGLSLDQVAGRMGVSRNTVITHVVAALADLDRLL